MRLKVVSDGTALGTRIVDAETGDAVQGITKITWSLEAGELSKAVVELDWVEAELEGEVK